MAERTGEMGGVVVAGSSGLIGTALVRALESEGTRVVRLLRPGSLAAKNAGTAKAAGAAEDAAADGGGTATWDPDAGTIDARALEGADAVVNLAGVGVADHRWTEAHKNAVLGSRVRSTTLLAETMAGMDRPPPVLVNASAIDYYGERGEEILYEDSGPGRSFLADVCLEWEAATEPAAKAGIRVACVRTGIVLSPDGGALGRLLLPFKLGAGGRIGPGTQWWSWISIVDEVAALLHVIRTAELSGAVNLTAPNPVRNAEFAATLARVLSRPALLPVPRFALRAALGEFADEALLGSKRILPRRLEESGFTFAWPELEPALRALVG